MARARDRQLNGPTRGTMLLSCSRIARTMLPRNFRTELSRTIQPEINTCPSPSKLDYSYTTTHDYGTKSTYTHLADTRTRLSETTSTDRSAIFSGPNARACMKAVRSLLNIGGFRFAHIRLSAAENVDEDFRLDYPYQTVGYDSK